MANTVALSKYMDSIIKCRFSIEKIFFLEELDPDRKNHGIVLCAEGDFECVFLKQQPLHTQTHCDKILFKRLTFRRSLWCCCRGDGMCLDFRGGGCFTQKKQLGAANYGENVAAGCSTLVSLILINCNNNTPRYFWLENQIFRSLVLVHLKACGGFLL